MTSEQKDKHNAIEKALIILSYFTPDNNELGTLEISQNLGYHKATVSRTLLLLARNGYLQQNRQNKKYRLGHASLALGMAVSRSLKKDLVQIAKPFADQLRDDLQESVVLELLYGKNIVMAYMAEGPRRIRLAGDVGDIMPVHASAGGKAIAAFATEEVCSQLLNKEFPKYTPCTITDSSVLRKQFKEIRKQGVAFDLKEQDSDSNAIASPILDIDENPVGALVVAGLTNRVGSNISSPIAAKVKETALSISRCLYNSTDKI